MKNYCCDRTEQKSAPKEVESDESDLVTPESGHSVRGLESEGPEALDVRSTFVAEVTYKQVVFSSGVPWGEGEKERRGIERGSGGEKRKGGEGGGEEEEEGEGPAGEGTLSEKEKAEQVEDKNTKSSDSTSIDVGALCQGSE